MKAQLIDLLNKYKPYDYENEVMLKKMLHFLDTNDEVFGKFNKDGHITASVWIVDKEYQKCFLTHHKKLNMWVQLGGHTELYEDIHTSALREAVEESGMENLELFSHDIFDIDVHLIPENSKEKAHYHYDIRFLIVVDSASFYIKSDESHEVAWVKLDEIQSYTKEKSILRMVNKVNGSVVVC